MARFSRRNFIKAGVVLGATPLIAQRTKVARRPPTTETVTFTIVDDEISCDKPSVELFPGDTVNWVSPGHPLSIQFPGVSPVADSAYHSDKSGSTSMTIPAATVLFGTFKYFVAVYDPMAGKILTADPDIIIKPKPPGGRPGPGSPSSRP
jgi:plastocyanin